MAQYNELVSRAIPRELELTRQFEVRDASPSELQEQKDRLFNADLEADLRNVLGRNMDRLSFLEATWEKWLQFVQKLGRPADRIDVAAAGPVEKNEITTRFRLTPGK